MQHGGNAAAAAAAAAALYDYQAGAGGTGDAVDAVTARWLQSTGLQHLASPFASTDQRALPNLLMQGYGPQTIEEKQKLYRLLRNLNFNSESGSNNYTQKAQALGGSIAADTLYSQEFRGEFGAGLLDLHSMDDTELLSEHVMSEPFETSPFVPDKGFDDDFDAIPGRQQRVQADTIVRSSANEKDITVNSNVAKIKVVVRKRPLNKKEISRKEDDIVDVQDNAYLTVYEPKLKVDLTAYVEKHEFCFDAVLDENVTNDEVYRMTVEPIIPTIFRRTKATCFAYGQTGSGKTFTMQPLPLRAAEDIVRLLHQPTYRSQKFRLWLSFFEIYGGKLFDLLSDRRKLCMREDGRQQVCIVGLQEFEVLDVRVVKEYIEKGNAARSTGSTGANEESSRSHAILQLAIKKHKEIVDTRRNYNDGNEPKAGKLIGKISFIDLAGSERGADTTDNDRQTRIEGAEINKSLLALKECIRALDNDQIHIPFRGSKLTEVLRDSFVGDSRTVMISCISPNTGSCEHTLNTLRYADRVKSLSKSSNPKKDSTAVPLPPSGKEASALPFSLYAYESEDLYEDSQDSMQLEIPKRTAETSSVNYGSEPERYSSTNPNYMSNGREEAGFVPSYLEKEKIETRSAYTATTSSQRGYSSQIPSIIPEEEKLPKVLPPRRKVSKDEKPEKQSNWSKKDNGSDLPTPSYKQAYEPRLGNTAPRQYEQETLCPDGEINLILEEEEALISAHRKEIENTMEIVREEMNLLAEVDRPGSLIDDYVGQLSLLLSRKAAGLVSLQARLSRFQHRLEEQEILSRKKPSR